MKNLPESLRHIAASHIVIALALLLLSISLSGAESAEEPSPVEALMENISRNMKKLSRQFDNEASRDSSIRLIDEMIKACLQAVKLEPDSLGSRNGEEKERYLARYREGLSELGRCLAAAKAALEANESGRAETLIDDAYVLREKFHEELL